MALQDVLVEALVGDASDPLTWGALADVLEDQDDPDADMLRVLPAVLAAIEAARDRLRVGMVEPACLRVHYPVGLWRWREFTALPGHPRPGTASRGFSHPVDVGGRPTPVLRNELLSGRRDWHALTRLVERFDRWRRLWDVIGLRLEMTALDIARGADSGRIVHIDLTRPR
jgi:hypothetical protein